MPITPPFYPIVYVRGFSPTAGSREGTFHDLYYGYADTSVDVHQKSPADAVTPETDRVALDLFEGQLIRFMKEFGYVDASHGGLNMATQTNTIGRPAHDPTRSIWISRFYDTDYLTQKVREITEHAQDLWNLIVDIRKTFVDLGVPNDEFKVILIAHSMGGLVCRNLIQQLLPAQGIDPKTIVHRLVTIATPHGGIDLGAIPDAFENFVVNTFNPGGTNIFKSEMMRKYLNLKPADPINSLGDQTTKFAFPPQRCFCVIGSNHKDYGIVQDVTGGYSDGLVKQNLAFIQDAYTANVHRSHSGYRGIVNSVESYENIHRFLFGDLSVAISMNNLTIAGTHDADAKDFYNIEFNLAVRNTGVYLHQRREDPCENALRYQWNAVPSNLKLHTAFLSTIRRSTGEKYLYFELGIRVVEHRVSHGLFWDHEYPGRTIYSESLEIRVDAEKVLDPKRAPGDVFVEYQWLSDSAIGTPNWTAITPAPVTNVLTFDLRAASTVAGKLVLTPTLWNV